MAIFCSPVCSAMFYHPRGQGLCLALLSCKDNNEKAPSLNQKDNLYQKSCFFLTLDSLVSRTFILQGLTGSENPICSHVPRFWIYGPCVLNNWNNLHVGSLIHGATAIMDFMVPHYADDIMLRGYMQLETTSSLYFRLENI